MSPAHAHAMGVVVGLLIAIIVIAPFFVKPSPPHDE